MTGGNMREPAPLAILGLLDGLSAGVLQLADDGRVRYANEAAGALLDSRPEDLVGVHLTDLVATPSDGDTVSEVLARVLDGIRWRGDLPIGRGSGAGGRLFTSWAPADENGERSVLLVLEPVAENTGARDELSGRLGRLAVVSTELLQATTVDGVMTVMTEHLAEAVGATVASVSLVVDDDTFALVSLFGGAPGTSDRWATYPVDRSTPVGDAFLDGRPLVLVGRDVIHERYPTLELTTSGERSMLCLPLAVAGRKLGVVGLSFPGRRELDTAELQYTSTLSDACAQALERIRAQEEAADREAKLRFLAEASVTLSSSLDYESTLAAVAHLAVPEFADWCVIHLVQDGDLRPIVTAHPDSLQDSRVQELQRRYPPDPESPYGVHEVVRTGRSVLLSDIPDELLVQAAHDEEHLKVLRELNFRSALQVPLKMHDRVFGVIAWVTGADGRRFSEDDLDFAEHLARRASVAIDNAQLHTEIRDVALRLQQAVLPDGLPAADGWDVALRYLPAGRTDIGGDFYDIAPLSGGRLAAFVGDVMGRGVEAASAMAQMRSALRTLVALDPEPTAVMAGLDRLFDQFDLEQLVTVAYAVIDPAAGTVQLVSAGHPAPVVVRAEDGVDHLQTEESLILGVGGGLRSVTTAEFRPGDTLLMFTDGLVERRDESLDDGARRLDDSSDLMRRANLETALVELVDRVRDQTRDDDVAALALRLKPVAVETVA